MIDPSFTVSPEPPAEGAEAPPPPADPPFPWDEPPAPGEAEDRPRQRHDAFTGARKCAFLAALVKTGCIIDACRRAGPSPRTVYRHQESDPRFRHHCETALRMAGASVELTAWERAVEGVEEEIAVGGKMVKRRRYDSGLLRLLLQGSNPKKYGPRPGFTRKRLLRHERKQMAREIRAEIEMESHPKGPPQRTFEEAVESIMTKIAAIERHREPQKLAAGWTRSPDGHWIPPGYAPIVGWAPPDGSEGDEPPGDSL